MPSDMRVLPICFFLFFCIGLGHAQVLPPIRSFEPSEYAAANQNWGVQQTDAGWMYFANNAGLLEFNGVRWTLYNSPNGSALRSVLALGERVYTGCYMEFGFWDMDPFGQRRYTSLSDGLRDQLLPDEEIWQIRSVGDWVLFQSLQRIYAFRADHTEITVIPAQASRAQLFGYAGELYYKKEDEGLMRLRNGQPEVLIPGQEIADQVFIAMAEVKGMPALIGEDGAFHLLYPDGIRTWTPPGLVSFPGIKLYSAHQLYDGVLALGSLSQGLILLDAEGEYMAKMGKAEGLNNNTVLAVFEDRYQNIWLGLDNGIGVINRGSAYREYIDREGKLGVVYTAKEYDGRLYLGTNQGLFKSASGLGGPYRLVPGTEGQVWALREYDGILLVGHHKGTFQVEGNGARIIAETPGTWEIKPVPGEDDLLMQGGYQGLSLLQKGDRGWESRNTLEGFGISSRFFEFTGPNHIIVNHEFKGVFDLDTDSALRRVTDSSQTPAFGFGASLFRFRQKVYYANSSGVFRYVGNNGGFVADTLLNTSLFSGVDNPIGVVLPDERAERIWAMGNSTIYQVEPEPLGGGLKTRTIHIPEGLRRRLGVVGFECIAPLENGQYLLGMSDGFLILNPDRLREERPVVQISKALHYGKNRDSLVGLPLMETPRTLQSARNNLEFQYGVPQYDKYREVEYQYWLEGLQEDWSAWSTRSEVRFDNLSFGDYTFHVRARIGEAESDGAVPFRFSISRPWYLTYWAIALFTLAAAGMAFLIHLRYRAYYRKQQAQLQSQARKKLKRKKLKARKKLVEVRNANLRQEIESKNRELAVSTMSLIRKNEFLNTLKEQLKKAENTAQIRSVIRTIDRNINNEEDWEFFEAAFNNADKDFLKNIKHRHPELTPNDLRLCAYLRLNLSSKEIAPLLNISVRSVEVKRYRLRKKMDLEHDQSLTNYILEL